MRRKKKWLREKMILRQHWNLCSGVWMVSYHLVGDAIHINGTIILPLVDVSFGIGAGAFSAEKKEKGMGGIGGKMSPSAVIVIQDGKTRLVNIKNQDTITKILDMVPDVVDRFTTKKEDKMTEKDVMDILDSDEES